MNNEQLAKKLDAVLEAIKYFTDKLDEFEQRFEEVVTQLEDERRLDLMQDNY